MRFSGIIEPKHTFSWQALERRSQSTASLALPPLTPLSDSLLEDLSIVVQAGAAADRSNPGATTHSTP